MKTGALRVNGAEMRYMRFGTEGAEPLVILPGLSVANVVDSAHVIAQAYAVFSDRFDVFLIERPNDPPPGYTVGGMAADTAAATDELGIRKANVIGVSQGGMIALTLAARRRDAVDKLVLVSTAARIPPQTAEKLGEWVALAQKKDAAALYESFAKSVYSDGFYEKIAAALREAAKSVSDSDLTRFATLARAVSDQPDPGDVRCPALVVCAENDRLLGTAPSVELAEKLGAELYVYPGFSHAVYDEAPDFKERALAFFLGGGERRKE